MSSQIQLAQEAWRALLGRDRVLVGGAIPDRFGVDTSASRRSIQTVLKIASSSQIPEVMRIAQVNRTVIHPISTGNNWGYGSAMPVVAEASILDLSELQAILHFDPELGVVTLEPGVTQGMLADFLDQGGHDYMVPVTGAGPNCSLLANALERGYGLTPYVDHFGALTDLEAVLPDGSIYRSALREAGTEELARLFKWGIGPYLNGIFTQSGFGVVTRASILLARRPECVKVCLFSLKDDALLEPAVDRIRELLQTLTGTLSGVNLMNRHRILAMTAPYPNVSELDELGLIPADHVAQLGRQYQVLPWTGFASLYGRKSVVKAAQQEIRAALKGIASRLIFLSPRQAGMLSRFAARIPCQIGSRLSRTAATLNASMQLVQGRPNETALPLAYWRGPVRPNATSARDPAQDGCGLFWYAPLIPMRGTDVRRFVEFATDQTRQHRLEPLITFTSQGDRLFDSTIPLLFDQKDPQAALEAANCLKSMTEVGQPLGFYPYRLHVDRMQDHLGRQPLAAELTQKLKRSLDPYDILAPGRYCRNIEIDNRTE